MDPGRLYKGSSWISTIKFLLVAGGGLFGDGYLNQTIGLVVPMIGYLYFADSHNTPSAIQSDEIKGSFQVGMVIGQLFFGSLGDALGRHRVYGKECLFVIFGTLMVILLPWKGLSHTGVVAWLSVFRTITGMGTGGDYPMTSTISTEHKLLFGSRAKLVLLVFAFLALGTLTAAVVYVILLDAFKSAVDHNIKHLEWVWRLLLGIGIIPAIFTLYARLQMRETDPYEQYVAKETSLTDKSKRGYSTQWHDFKVYFSEWRHAKVLFSSAFGWFLFDIAYYGISLNQATILKDIGFGTGSTPWETMHKTAIGNVIVSFAGQLPGSWLGIFMPDLFGRRKLLIYSSLLTAALYAIWAGVNNMASSGGLMVLFALSQFTLNAGPTVTVFLLPVELFPTRVRATAHGISAASGKVGAVLTAFAFGSINQTLGLRGALGLFSGVMVMVAVVSLWLPETKGLTLQDIEDGVVYGDKPHVIEVSSDGPSPSLKSLGDEVDVKAFGDTI
ncbi:inorganic phosphate transporter [Trichoderma ceciliae]